MLDKIKKSVSDVLTGDRQQSTDGEQAGGTLEQRTGTASDVSGVNGQDAGSEDTDQTETNLFQCPSCEAVFVATDKDTCSTCRTAVDQIE